MDRNLSFCNNKNKLDDYALELYSQIIFLFLDFLYERELLIFNHCGFHEIFVPILISVNAEDIILNMILL